MTWFLIGAIIAGVANDFTHMLIGRSLQGVGGGGIITLTAIVIADIVPLSQRAKYFGMLSAIWSLGTVIGPVIGGCFAEKATWVRAHFDFSFRELGYYSNFLSSAGYFISTSLL
jgi:MFS family permease